MEEKAHLIKVEAIESLEHKFSLPVMERTRDAGMESVTLYMRNAIDTVIRSFHIPAYDHEECCQKFEEILSHEITERVNENSERLRLAPNTYAINEIRRKSDFELAGSWLAIERWGAVGGENPFSKVGEDGEVLVGGAGFRKLVRAVRSASLDSFGDLCSGLATIPWLDCPQEPSFSLFHLHPPPASTPSAGGP